MAATLDQSLATEPAIARPDTTLYCHSPYQYARRRTHVVMVGDVGVGGDNPIRVQSMTTTKTMDTDATVEQAIRLVRAGCEIVRITAPTVKAARNLGLIRDRLRGQHIHVPLVADIHFSPEAALEAAEHVEKVRVNPGNYADSRQFAVREYTDAEYRAELQRIEERFAPLVVKCKARGIAMRIGTNHGSLSDRIVNRFGDTPEGMVESALEFVRICEKYEYRSVILSMKASNPKVMIAAYRLLAGRMAAFGMTYPFHLGVTEAGNGIDARSKSAIGIGSLLADGIGDTIRVSLAEEPEAEIPVSIALAGRFDQASHLAGATKPLLTESMPPAPWDPYHYARRESTTVAVGTVLLGGSRPIAVAARAGGPPEEAALQILRWASPGARRLRRPDVTEWTLRSDADMAALERLHQRLVSARALSLLSSTAASPTLAIVASAADATLLARALPYADGVLLLQPQPAAAQELARQLQGTGKALWLEGVVDASNHAIGQAVDTLLAAVEATRPMLADAVVVGISAVSPEALIHAQRLLAARLATAGLQPPLFVRSPEDKLPLIPASLSIGSLLCDGLGDVVLAQQPERGQEEVGLTFDVLQAAGARLSKTDYVACPSCGRTLFDLQSTTERIKARTSHLVGVKIAIMGCVVNGPGEMADADFGYVGGGPGRVNLYVGKTCVERNVPAEEADERLIALIRERGRWQEPDLDEPEEHAAEREGQ